MKHWLALAALLFCCAAALSAGAAKKPNVVVILNDDMGFSDRSPVGLIPIESTPKSPWHSLR